MTDDEIYEAEVKHLMDNTNWKKEGYDDKDDMENAVRHEVEQNFQEIKEMYQEEEEDATSN